MAAPFSPESRRLRSHVGNLIKADPTHPEIPAARRDLRAARLADHIQATLDAIPPLTDDQCATVAALLRPGVEA